MTKFKSILTRFVKGFVAGGLSSVAVLLSAGTGTDLKKFGLALIIAFVSGGILAVEKSLNWTPTDNSNIPTSGSYGQ